MNTIILFALLSGANPYTVGHPYPTMEFIGSGGGPFAGQLCLNDDIRLGFGTGATAVCGDEPFWKIYNSTATQFEQWSTDCDGSGTDCAWFQLSDGTDDPLFTGTLGGVPPSTDTAPRVFGLGGADSWAQATGANQTGGALALSGGLGTRQIVCSDRTLADTDTVTFTVDGSATVLTESTDFDCEGEASEEVCCDNLGAAITTAALGITPDCATTAGTCYLTAEPRLQTVTVAIADGGVNGAFGTATNGTDGVIELQSETNLGDNLKLTLGNSGSTDSYLDFTGTNLRFYSSGDIEFLASPIIGTIEVDADSGAVAFLNMEVSATPAAGTEESLTVQIDSNAHTKFYCEADSSGSVEDCHLIQSYAPALVPSSDQALAGDAAFDCDEGINRIAGSGGAVTLSAAPSINDGDVDGQICYVQGTSDVNTVQINDNTNVQLAGGANFVMGAGDMLVLAWDSGDSNWYEISRSDN